MALVDWRIKGPELSTCNCDWGCPCQFNALPSNGNCRAAVGMRIDQGHFGDVSLDGLKWAGLFSWPGAIHEGEGEAQPIIDIRANERQREALLKILSGAESEPGTTIFQVLSTTLTTLHEPLFQDIEFEADMEARTGRIRVADVVEAIAEPIRNPVTGESHRARVVLPKGFEYTEAEFASSTTKSEGAIALNWANCHAHFAVLHMTGQGVVR